MFFALFGLSLSANEYVVLPSQMTGTYEFIAKRTPHVIDFFIPEGRYLSVITSLPDGAVVEIYSPTTGEPIIMEKGKNAHYFPISNAKYTVTLPLIDQKIAFAVTSLPGTKCSNGIYVSTDPTLNYTREINKSMDDFCIFYAPIAESVGYKWQPVDIKENQRLEAYHTVPGSPVDIKYGPLIRKPDESINMQYTTGVWLLRYIGGKDVEGYAGFQCEAFNPAQGKGVLPIYNGFPIRYDNLSKDQQPNEWYIPFLGCIAPAFLLVCFIYTIVHLSRKPKAKGASLEAELLSNTP